MAARDLEPRKALDRAFRRVRNARTLDDLIPDWEEIDRSLTWAITSARRRQHRGLSLLARADLDVIRSEIVPKLHDLLLAYPDPAVREWSLWPEPGTSIEGRPEFRHVWLLYQRAWRIRYEAEQTDPKKSNSNVAH